jgi:hypothetical protein
MSGWASAMFEINCFYEQTNICDRMSIKWLISLPVRCEDDASSTIPDFAYHIPEMSFSSRIHACGWFIQIYDRWVSYESNRCAQFAFVATTTSKGKIHSCLVTDK